MSSSNIMISKQELIQSSASDFGNYVYCGMKFFLNKTPGLKSFRNAKIGSYDISKNTSSRILGQSNEHKCIEWIKKNHKGPQEIIFDGTGKDNQQTFPAIINTNKIYVTIQCRPDLILRRANNTVLYEFKSVSDSGYLFNSEYDSVHAQIWCYRFIEHFKIDKYFLFRYFEDPFKWNTFPKETELTEEKLSDDKFIPLFEKYLKTVEILNKGYRISEEELGFISFNKPVNQPDKCHHCMYYDSNYCKPQCEPKK